MNEKDFEWLATVVADQKEVINELEKQITVAGYTGDRELEHQLTQRMIREREFLIILETIVSLS